MKGPRQESFISSRQWLPESVLLLLRPPARQGEQAPHGQRVKVAPNRRVWQSSASVTHPHSPLAITKRPLLAPESQLWLGLNTMFDGHKSALWGSRLVAPERWGSPCLDSQAWNFKGFPGKAEGAGCSWGTEPRFPGASLKGPESRNNSLSCWFLVLGQHQIVLRVSLGSDHSWCVQGATWGTRGRTQFGCMQGKFLVCYTITSPRAGLGTGVLERHACCRIRGYCPQVPCKGKGTVEGRRGQQC